MWPTFGDYIDDETPTFVLALAIQLVESADVRDVSQVARRWYEYFGIFEWISPDDLPIAPSTGDHWDAETGLLRSDSNRSDGLPYGENGLDG